MNSFKDIFSIDHRSLRLYRVCFSLILIFDIINRLSLFDVLYSNTGYLPVDFVPDKNSFFNFFLWFKSDYLVFTQFVLGLISGLFLLLGIKPKINVIFIWFFYNSLSVRNPYVLHSAEDIMRVLCFWNLFLTFNFRTKKLFSYASFGVLLQIVAIYVSLMLKRETFSWFFRADAMKIALESYPITSSLGEWIGQYDFVCKWLTRVGYLFELIVPILVFIPYGQNQIRKYTPFLMILFHFTIYLLFELSTFPFVGMLLWTLFIGTQFWETGIGKKLNSFLPPGDYKPQLSFNKYLVLIVKSFRRVVITYGVVIVLLAIPSRKTISNDIFIFLYMKPLNYLNQYAKIGQNWIMFTPTPSLMSSWHQLVGRTKNDTYDLLTGESPSLTKPANTRELYDGFQQWRYIWSLTTDLNYDNRLYKEFFKFHCRTDKELILLELNFLTYSLFLYEDKTYVAPKKAYDCRLNKVLPDKFNP